MSDIFRSPDAKGGSVESRHNLSLPQAHQIVDISNALFDQIMYDKDSQDVLNKEQVKSNMTQRFDEVSSFVDNVYGLLNSTSNLELRDTCIDVIEKWRFFFDANDLNLANHVYMAVIDENGDNGKASLSDLSHFQTLVTAGLSNRGRIISGIASRDSIDKTASIITERRFQERKTGKYISRSKNYLVHDEFNIVSAGNHVMAIECRPLSKRKHFRLLGCAV